jgi:Protein of unknown function (DUF2934)
MEKAGEAKYMPMKTFIPQRTAVSTSVRSGARRNSPAHQQLPLRSLPDCLLAAYDEVSHRAFERFVARGSQPGNEIADWRAAEKDLFLPVDVDFEDTPEILYALATIAPCGDVRTGVAVNAPVNVATGMAGELAIGLADEVAIEVAIEDRWLLIWVHPHTAFAVYENYQENVARSSAHESRELKLKWIEWEDLHHILQDSENSSGAFADSSSPSCSAQPHEPAAPVIARPFSVVELPADIDVSRSSAVLSDGLIAIRMPKLKTATPDPVAQPSAI